MAAMADAGVDTYGLLEFQERGAEPLLARRLLMRIRGGMTFWRALSAEKFSALDVAMVRAGEENGSFVTVARSLAEYYRERYDIERTLKYALMKPVFLFWVSETCAALPPFFLGRIGLVGFLARSLIPILAVVAGLYYGFNLFWRASRDASVRVGRLEWLTRVPRVAAIGRAMAMERFFTAFLICVRAGSSLESMVGIFKAVAKHPALGGVTRAFDSQLVVKEGFAPVMAASGVFTDDQVASIRTGEITGRLEQQLDYILKDLRGEITGLLLAFADWAPRVLYSLIAVAVVLNMIF